MVAPGAVRVVLEGTELDTSFRFPDYSDVYRCMLASHAAVALVLRAMDETT